MNTPRFKTPRPAAQGNATKALLYCRVSTTKQTIEGSGLQSQELRCRAYAEEHGYQVEAVFPDDVSGGGDFMLRPGMVALLGYLDRYPGQDYVVIFDDLKRLARDTTNHLKLRQAFDLRGARVECLNFKFEETPEGQFVETVFAAQGQLEREQNRRQTIQKMKARVQAGYYCRSKPIGYRYQKFPEHGKMLVPDEKTAPFIKEAFEGYASDRFETGAEVARFLKAQPTITGSITRQRVSEILRRPIYAGYISLPEWGFHMHKGKHEPLVSLAIWQAVQDKIEGKANRPKRADIHEDFPLRNFVACESCGNALTAGWSKGKTKHYGYYTCHQQGCDLRRKSIRKETVEAAFKDLVQSMTPRPELIKLATAMFRDIWDDQAARLNAQREELTSQMITLDRKMGTLMKRLVSATSDAVIGAYESEIAKIEHEKRLLEDQSQNQFEPRKSFDDSLGSALQFLANPWVLWERGTFAEKRLLLKLTAPGMITYTRENGFLNTNLSLPFSILGGDNIEKMKMVRSRSVKSGFYSNNFNCV